MNTGIKNFIGAVALITASLGGQAFAQSKDCIVLKTTAEVEQEVVNAKGEKSTTLAPANKVVPGDTVVWTVTANNVCDKPSDKVTINNPVPEHMSYIANSAMGAATDITYSIDGTTFGTPDQLTVTENGATRKARADEYKHIRWVFKNSLLPGASAFARFRAVLN